MDEEKLFAGRCGVKEEKTNTLPQKWVCTLCGWEYDGDIPFEDLPEDWRCPLCGVGKELFERR